LFSPAENGLRELKRENNGHKLASEAGVNVPEQVFISDNIGGCSAVIYRFVENAKSFSLSGSHINDESVVKLFELLVKLHLHGVYQDDIHMDNILMTNKELYLIDLGSVVCEKKGILLSKKASLKNLAKLVSQFIPTEQVKLIQRLEVYYQERGWGFDEREYEEFLELLSKVWNKSKRDYLSKCFRTCTMTTYKHSFIREYAFRTSFLSAISFDVVKDIELLMSRGQVIKAGNSATVVRLEADGKQLIIKRYNIKNGWHFLRRCLRQSRAAVSWRNANLLEFIGMPTPKPLGFIEQRTGWFRHTAYFISEYTQAEQLLDVYHRRQPSKDELEQISSIFILLQKCRISHGDMKASNLLIDCDSKVSVIDLDAMQEHGSDRLFQRKHNKDKNRFLRNWNDLKLKKIFSTLICADDI